MGTRFKQWLASPRATFTIALLSVIVVLPSLGYGLAADDYWHKVVLTRDPAYSGMTPPWYSLFTFFDGQHARTQMLTDLGMSPWWGEPSLRVTFFRPLSAATHALDYLLWPDSPWLMHAQSILWYGALVALATWVYRRVLVGRGSAWIPGAAGLLYGFDHNHGTPIGWLANRNAIVAAVFALAALGVHDVAVRSSRRALSVASAVLLALGLASGESAVAVVGFLVAHAWFLDDRRWAARLSTLAPQLAVLVAWTLVYRLGDFGVHGSGVYLGSACLYLAAVSTRLPLLLAGELGAPGIDVYSFLPRPGRIAMLVACIAFLAWCVPALVRVVRAEKTARFFLVGSILATLPACAVFPSGRTMVLASFGLIGLIALVGAGVLEGAAWLPLPSKRFTLRLVRSFAIWSFGGHLLLAPLAMQITLRQLFMLENILARIGTAMPVGEEATKQRILIMNAPDTVFIAYVTTRRQLKGEQVPRRLLVMAGGQRALDFARTDDQTVVVTAEGGFYREGTELLTRGTESPMPVGTHAHVGTIDIEILETGSDGVPTKAAFRFPGSADAADLAWMRWENGVLVATAPPRVGEHVSTAGQLPDMF